jgi:tRNA pseudouridine synthase 10
MKTNRAKKKTKNQIFSKKAIAEFFSKHSRKALEKYFPFPPKVYQIDMGSPFSFSLNIEQEPVFIGGRYKKLSRDLPQTPWIIEGERIMQSSVEELIIDPIKPFLKANEYKFSSSGREDVDVLMLGNGRPFVIECLNPRRLKLFPEEFQSLEKTINGNTDKISVHKMAMVSLEATTYLRKIENEKHKLYSAECYSNSKLSDCDMKKLTNVRNLVINQKTPIR